MYNPSDEDENGDNTFGQCNCCGEDCQSHGMCVSCVQRNCHPDFTEACRRTGESDPLNLISPDYSDDSPPSAAEIAGTITVGGVTRL